MHIHDPCVYVNPFVLLLLRGHLRYDYGFYVIVRCVGASP